MFKLAPDLARNDQPQYFFAPTYWRVLDAHDQDLGGVTPLLLRAPVNGGAQPLVLALGKDRRAYLLNADNLGGIGGQLVSETVSSLRIITADAAYPVGGDVFVAFQGPGADCPTPRRDNELTVLRIHGGSPPALETAWCGALIGRGSPVVTTTDGQSDPSVWILGPRVTIGCTPFVRYRRVAVRRRRAW